MSVSFGGVTGFNLKWPERINSRPELSGKGEWIEINKKANQLPTAILRTWVLYYRYNGDESPSSIGDIDLDNPSDTDYNSWSDGQPNFRFYNNDVNSATDMSGGQLGSIWGFPLFNVDNDGQTNDEGPANWPFFKSCITGVTDNPAGGKDISGNERMLVDLDNRNLVVIDFSGYDEGTPNKKCFDDISNNLQPYVNDAFYMTLRIKSSTERLVPSDNTNANGKHFHAWRRYNIGNFHAYYKKKKKFCSLVEYIYECDIVGPKPMLDLTLKYFSYHNTDAGKQGGRLFGFDVNGFNDGQNTQAKRLAIPRYNGQNGGDNLDAANSYTTDISINIITGRGWESSSSAKNRMDTVQIYSNLTYSNERDVLLQKNDYFSASHSGISLIKIIGGKFDSLTRYKYSADSIGYYGSNYGTKWNETNSANSNGWQWDIDLSANSNLNKWPTNNTYKKNYDLNNILWCSLRSPKKYQVRRIISQTTSNTNEQFRFVTNFIDLSGAYSVGGGFGRDSNTIDMPRSSLFPYYASSGGNDCVSINNYDTTSTNPQYLDASNSILPGNITEFNDIRTIHEVGHYKIYYKLLIPPEGGTVNNCSITYTFGKNNNSKVTFFRESGTGTSFSPPGNESTKANRTNELVTLTWAPGETDIKTITLTDVAAGFSKHTANISFGDTYLNNTIDDNTEDYSINCNIFQPLFTAINNEDGTLINREDNPYSVQIFDSNSTERQYYDLSYVPQNYIPYRYADLAFRNINTTLSGQSSESFFYWPDSYSHPILSVNEQFKYNVDKVYPRLAGAYDFATSTFNTASAGAAEDGANLPTAVIIDPSSQRFVDEINIDISNTIIDASYSVIASQLNDSINTLISQEEVVIFIKQVGNDVFTLNDNEKIITPVNKSITFYAPVSLSEKNNLISDYWLLPEKINKLRKNDQGSGIISWDKQYGFFSKWENQTLTSAVYDILNIILKGERTGGNTGEIGGLLINSNKNSIEWSAVDTEGRSITGNLIFEVQGANGLPAGKTLIERPIVVQMTTISTGPFGSTSVNYIGDTAGGTNSGINNSAFNAGPVLPPTMRQGNNNGNNFPNTVAKNYNGLFSISMRGWKEDPVLTPPRQNPFYNNISISPNPLNVLLVDISGAVQTNGTDYREMVSSNNEKVIIKWTGFYFSSDASWNTFPLGQDGDIEWTITRYNKATGMTETRYTGLIHFNLITNEYIWEDTNINVYDKYTWSVTGSYKWYGITKLIPGSAIPSINVPGFVTPECFICKFNRFPYGRYNTTSTNLKLFAPLKINLPEGQVNQFGRKTCGGVCGDPDDPSIQLFSRGPRISSSNNIYANTTNQLSKKQTYVLLAKSRFRPSR